MQKGTVIHPPGVTSQVATELETLLRSGSKTSSVLGVRTGFTPCERSETCCNCSLNHLTSQAAPLQRQLASGSQGKFLGVCKPSLLTSPLKSVSLRQRCNQESLESDPHFGPLLTAWAGRGPESLQGALARQVTGASALQSAPFLEQTPLSLSSLSSNLF